MRKLEQAPSRAKPAPVGHMFRALVLFLQMDEGASQLNQPLEKPMSGTLVLEPQVLENVMRLVILLFVEANKITLVTRIMTRFRDGIVTPCERFSSRTKSALLTVNSMDGSLLLEGAKEVLCS